MSISTFSLVAIAIERYSAICNPLKSRVWQTRSHAYRVIAATWVLAFLIMIPYPIISHLDSFQRPDNTTAHQCRHKWPLATAEQTWWVYRFETKVTQKHIAVIGHTSADLSDHFAPPVTFTNLHCWQGLSKMSLAHREWSSVSCTKEHVDCSCDQ